MNPLEISVDQFRRLAEQVTQLGAEYLQNLDAQAISPATNGAEMIRVFGGPTPEQGLGEEALEEAAQTTFAHSGDYARSLSADPVKGFAFFEESLELSRRFRALKLWLSLRYHGFGALRESIARDLAHAQRLAEAINSEPQLELLTRVELSAVCFRHKRAGRLTDEELNRFNQALLNRVVQRGRVYLSNATLHSRFCLRACIVNHRTKDADVDGIIPEVLAAAKEIA